MLVGSPEELTSAQNALYELGVPLQTSDSPTLSAIRNATVTLMHVAWMRRLGTEFKSLFEAALESSKLLSVYGDDSGNVFIQTISESFMRDRLAVVVGEPTDIATKSVRPVFSSGTALYAIYAKNGDPRLIPSQLIIQGGFGDVKRHIINLLNWVRDLGIISNVEPVERSITEINGFQFIGSIDWKFYNMCHCDHQIGDLQVRGKYYYYSETISGTTYKWFLAYINHLTTGYDQNYWCGWSYYDGWAFSGRNGAYTRIDGKTDEYAGQVFDDMGPKNPQNCVSSIPYTVSAGVGCPPPTGTVSASVGVTYNPNQMSHTSTVNTQTGWVEWTHKPCQYVEGQTWWVEPSAIFYLDPNKQGGVEPMIFNHQYKSGVRIYWGIFPSTRYIEWAANHWAICYSTHVSES